MLDPYVVSIGWIWIIDTDNMQFFQTAGPVQLHGVAFVFTEERLCNRGQPTDFSVCRIQLVQADDGDDVLLLRCVAIANGCTKKYLIVTEVNAGIDYFRAFNSGS